VFFGVVRARRIALFCRLVGHGILRIDGLVNRTSHVVYVLPNVVGGGEDFTLNLVRSTSEFSNSLPHGAGKRWNSLCPKEKEVNQKNKDDFRHAHGAKLRQQPACTYLSVMFESMPCPACISPYGYSDGTRLNCPECGHVWDADTHQEAADESDDSVFDVNGTPLADGDSVIVIKNLPVKGAPKPVKAGTKVKNIRLSDGDHNIACKIDGFGAMGLKSEFVKKA